MYKYIVHMVCFQGSSEELSPDTQIGSLLMSPSGNRQLELHLCKMVTLIVLSTFLCQLPTPLPNTLPLCLCILGQTLRSRFRKQLGCQQL